MDAGDILGAACGVEGYRRSGRTTAQAYSAVQALRAALQHGSATAVGV